MTKPSVAPGPGRFMLIMMLLVTLLGLGLRLFRLSNQSLWTDEVSSLTVAQVPLDRICDQSARENNSLPTYFLLLRPLAGKPLDHIEAWARLPSALAGALSIPVLMGVVYLWQRRAATALVAGLLLAANPLHIWYSQEARAYALMLFFGLLSVLGFELARTRPKALWQALYIVSALAAMALHKTGLIFPAACALWHGFATVAAPGEERTPPEPRRYAGLLLHVPILLAALVLLSLKSYPPGEGYGRRGSVLELVYTFMTFVGGYSFGPSVTEIQSHGAGAAVSRHAVQVGIVFLVLALATLVFVLNLRRLVSGKAFLLLALGIGGVAGYAFLSGFPYNVRYVLPALFGFIALVATYIDCPRWPALSRLCVGSLLVVALWADAQWFYGPIYRKGDSRAVARWLVENRGHVKSWTVLPGYLSRSVEWYLQPYPEVLASALPAKEDRTTSFPPVPDVLILGRRHHLQEPEKLLESYQAAAGKVQSLHSFAGFELYVRESAQ